MTSRIYGAWVVLVTIALFGIPPVVANHGSDDCAGGVDAGDWYTQGSTLQRFYGCAGQLYNSEDGSQHDDDLYDAYKVYVTNAKLKAYVDYQACNHSSDVPMIYQVLWRTDGLSWSRLLVGSLDPGECTSPSPERVEGGLKPGTWVFTMEAWEEWFPGDGTAKYTLYVVPT